MASLPLATLERYLPERKPYHCKVFTLDGIRRVVEDHRLPGMDWRSDPLRRYDRFIEMQVWDDAPILEFLGRSGQSMPEGQGKSA
jgi:hypothetical protein